MARIILQKRLFDYTEIDQLGDLERLKIALEGIDDENLMMKLENKRGKGRNDYPVRVMFNLFIALKIFGHESVDSFRRELNRNSQLRRACGLFDDERKKHIVPPARVFTNFTDALMDYQDEIDKIFAEQVEKLYELIPGFGKTLAGDGKYIDSFANNKHPEDQIDTDRRTENDAEWSVKVYKYRDAQGNDKEKREYHFGFKMHVICDVETELPITFSLTKANADEKKEMTKLLECPLLSDKYRNEIEKRLLILDRGYDSTEMINTIIDSGMYPIIDIRNCWKDGEETKQYKDTNIVYDFKGNVYYIDNDCIQYKMKYEGYDKQKKCLMYSHKGKRYRIYTSYDERIFLPIARDSGKFRKIYKGRTSVERLNGRIDRDYMFERHTIRGLNKMKLMVSLSLIIMNGMAIGKILNNIDSIRSLKKVS